MASRRAPFDPGQRDQIITIQQGAQGVDSEGAPLTTWTTLVASMPAARSDIQGRERLTADQLSARWDVRFEINYRADMDPNLVDVPTLRRVLHEGREHEVVFASVIGRREGIELLTLGSSRI